MKKHSKCILFPILIVLILTFANCEKEEQAEKATVSTLSVTNITATTAQSGGIVTDDGGATVTARGVVWSTTPNPTIENNEGYTTDGSGLGEFTSTLTGLSPETRYYVRAYATNDVGVMYGDEKEFITDEVFFDEFLLIGKWVSETLYYRYNANGTGSEWDTADGVNEDEAHAFTWTLEESTLSHFYIMEMGPIIPKHYTILKLTTTKLEYEDDSGRTFSFSKVN